MYCSHHAGSLHRCNGKYKIVVAGRHFGNFVCSDMAVQHLLKKSWKNTPENYFHFELKKMGMLFVADVVFIPVPHKISELP